MADGVVVIDDPISSLDSSAIYQEFLFLKNEAKDAKQLFILTHNFEFLKLLINWLENSGLKRPDRSYKIVLCTETASGRSAHLAPLDQLLTTMRRVPLPIQSTLHVPIRRHDPELLSHPKRCSKSA